MILLPLIAVVFAILALVAAFQRQWWQAAGWAFASSFLIVGGISLILSWNAAMLKVQHDAATRAAATTRAAQ